MRSITPFFTAIVLSCCAAHAQACGVDAVAAKTDTSITITWNVSGCKKLSAHATFEVCWKNTGAWTFPCGANRLPGYGETGTTTVTGLQPSTAYKVRTKWHHRSTGWHVITNRTVTTDPPKTSSGTVLRYVKASGQPYCTAFYWKDPPPTPSGYELILLIQAKTVAYFNWDKMKVAGATFNAATGEYRASRCGFSNNLRYRATVARIMPAGDIHTSGNSVEWK